MNRVSGKRHNGTSVADPARRRLLLAGGLTLGAATLGSWGWLRPAAADDAASQRVRIVIFDDHGRRVGERLVPKVVKTPAQWRRQLSALAYHVTRESGTERAFSGDYEKPARPGFYRCICCGTALFDAATQFHSGTGWPSFWQVIAPENVTTRSDHSFGMIRTAISYTRCDAHLGHLFHDGPQPTGLRYCMNSVALHFIETA